MTEVSMHPILNGKQNNLENVKRPVFIEFTPEYEREHGLSNEIDRFETSKFEKSPEEDEFCPSGEENLAQFSTVGAAKIKAPSGAQVVTTIVMVKEILNVLNDALKSGRNLYESVMDWINSNDMSDKEKVKAMQLGGVLAKQMSPAKEAA